MLRDRYHVNEKQLKYKRMHRAGKYLTLFLASLAPLWASPLWAAESEGGDQGLPQFDVALYPGQIFWLAITFGLLYLLMAYVALPGVSRTQDKRQRTIENDLGLAAKANEEAKATLAHYEKTLAEARAKAQVMLSDLTAKAASEAAERQAAQQQELVKRIAEAEGRIAATRDAAIREVHEMVFDLASSMVAKVAGGLKLGPAQAVRRS